MRLKSVVNAAAYGISASVLSFAMAANANAQYVSTGCQPKAQVEAAIASGGFKPIALGNRVDGVGNANIYFANKEGYGFSAEGDRPLGTPTVEQICVTGNYKEVRVNDPRNKEIPSWLTIKDGDGKTTANIRKAYEAGDRIVFTARSYQLDAAGKEQIGRIVGIAASPDKIASVFSIDTAGLARSVIALKNFALTSTANAFVVAQAPAPAIQQTSSDSGRVALVSPKAPAHQ